MSNKPVLDSGPTVTLKPMTLGEFKARNRRLEAIAQLDTSSGVLVSDTYWKPLPGEKFLGQFVGIDVRELDDKQNPGQKKAVPHAIFDTYELGTISHAGCVLIDTIVTEVPINAVVEVTYVGRPKKAMIFAVRVINPDGSVLDVKTADQNE